MCHLVYVDVGSVGFYESVIYDKWTYEQLANRVKWDGHATVACTCGSKMFPQVRSDSGELFLASVTSHSVSPALYRRMFMCHFIDIDERKSGYYTAEMFVNSDYKTFTKEVKKRTVIGACVCADPDGNHVNVRSDSKKYDFIINSHYDDPSFWDHCCQQ